MTPSEVPPRWFEAVGFARRPDVRTLRLFGPDRVRYLNGMISRDVSKLAVGAGVLAVKSSARGRVEAIVRVRARPETLDLDVNALVADALRANLEKLIIMDDCALEDVSGSREVLGILGAMSARTLEGLGFDSDLSRALPSDHGFIVKEGATLIRDPSFGLEGFELHLPLGEADGFVERLVARGAVALDGPELDVLRVEAGRPVEGREIDDDVIALEARLDPLIDFGKGCYVGQEVIARAHNLGGVKHILVGLGFEGPRLAPEGSALYSMDDLAKPTGEVCSVVVSPRYGPIGLAFVRRIHEVPGVRLLAKTPDGDVPATVRRLPFA